MQHLVRFRGQRQPDRGLAQHPTVPHERVQEQERGARAGTELPPALLTVVVVVVVAQSTREVTRQTVRRLAPPSHRRGDVRGDAGHPRARRVGGEAVGLMGDVTRRTAFVPVARGSREHRANRSQNHRHLDAVGGAQPERVRVARLPPAQQQREEAPGLLPEHRTLLRGSQRRALPRPPESVIGLVRHSVGLVVVPVAFADPSRSETHGAAVRQGRRVLVRLGRDASPGDVHRRHEHFHDGLVHVVHHEVPDQRVSVDVVVHGARDGQHASNREPPERHGQVVIRRARRATRDEVREERVARFLPARAGVDDAEASLRKRSPRDLQE